MNLEWLKNISLKVIPQALQYKIDSYNKLLEKFPDLEIECGSFENFLSHEENLFPEDALLENGFSKNAISRVPKLLGENFKVLTQKPRMKIYE